MFVILSGSEESFAEKTLVRPIDSSAAPQNDTTPKSVSEHRNWFVRREEADSIE